MSVERILLCHVTPALPPVVNGIGDYAAVIGELLQRHVENRYVTLGHCGKHEYEGYNVVQLESQRPDTVCMALAGVEKGTHPTVLIQYCGYAYQRRGCPVWLISALQRLKRRRPDTKVITMFHELYAFGPIWRSSFWLSPLQRALARRLFSLSDSVVTNCYSIAEELCKWDTMKSVNVLPVPSNVGEPTTVNPDPKREPALVIFGQLVSRNRAAECLREHWAVFHALGFQEIWDIGPGETNLRLRDTPVRKFGFCEPATISRLLNTARAGFIAYQLDRLTRSGVFAAYAAHRLLPFVHATGKGTSTTLRAYEHFVPTESGSPRMTNQLMQSIAQTSHTWYQEHSAAQHAALFHTLIEQTCAQTERTH